MSEDETPDRIERPIQATPGFFVETITEHESRDEIEAGLCTLLMEDGGRRRFVINQDVNELAEDDYVIELGSDLLDLIEDRGIFNETVEATVPVDDADRVVKEAAEDGEVTLFIDEEALAGMLAKFLATLAIDR